jgi:citrate lyase subunit beta/citryl-CoA lyase
MDNKPRINRSLVFAPAHDRDRILRAADNGPDALCLDMEDLTPTPNKDDARKLFASVKREIVERGIKLLVRTNSMVNGQAALDLEAVVSPELHCASLPKATRAEEVQIYSALLDAAEAKAGLPIGYTLIRPVVETAMGVKNAYEIAAASPRVAYMGGVSGNVWGDLGSSIGYTPMPEGKETFYVRAKMIVDVRAADVPFPISGGGMIRTDLVGYERFVRECKNLGYNGVHCRDTKEMLDMVHRVFTPTPEQIAQWQYLVPQVEEADKAGFTVAHVDDLMLDTAGLVRAVEQLELARRLGLI